MISSLQRVFVASATSCPREKNAPGRWMPWRVCPGCDRGGKDRSGCELTTELTRCGSVEWSERPSEHSVWVGKQRMNAAAPEGRPGGGSRGPTGYENSRIILICYPFTQSESTQARPDEAPRRLPHSGVGITFMENRTPHPGKKMTRISLPRRGGAPSLLPEGPGWLGRPPGHTGQSARERCPPG
jgi:hypothetical protein